MQKIAFITGITGQDGSYLANLLLQKKYRVVGLASSTAPEKLWRLNHFNISRKIKLVMGDIADAENLEKIIRQHRPHEFYNLAGQSSVVKSWKNPAETFRVNALAVVALLDILR